MTRNYHKSTLRKLSGKANYYVVVTKPKQLANRPKEVERRSTGTSDAKLAGKLKHKITQDIYSEWDAALERDRFMDTIKQYWDDTKIGQSIEETRTSGPALISGEKVVLIRTLMVRNLITIGVLNSLFEHLNLEEARKVRIQADLLWEDSPNPYPANIEQRRINEGLADKIVTKDAPTALNETGCPTILDLLPNYMNDIRWQKITKKEKQYAPNYIKNCVNIIGDKPIDQILPKDAHSIGVTLDEAGLANSTIKTYKRHLSNLLTFAREKETNDQVIPATRWIETNPFYGVSMNAYGAEKRTWEALEDEQLFNLFRLDMPPSDRLLLSILITTGMRLDEAALLTWDQYKVDKEGLRYFDLSAGAIVKNDAFSARTVAIPDILKIPEAGDGRLFDFKLDADGKSSKDASRHLNERYIHKIRNGETDNRKVVHSLRHNLSGFMSNLSPQPASEEMDWVTGHGMEGNIKQSERRRTYKQDISVRKKYEIVNRIKHPWLT